MAKFLMTVKLGTNGAAISARNAETGEVIGFTILGPPKLVQALIKSFEASPEIEVKYE